MDGLVFGWSTFRTACRYDECVHFWPIGHDFLFTDRILRGDADGGPSEKGECVSGSISLSGRSWEFGVGDIACHEILRWECAILIMVDALRTDPDY